MKNTIITLIENEVRKILLKESFRGFKLTKFASMNSYIDMVSYANDRLPFIGEGSSRTVFGLGAGKVLKIAGSGHVYKNFDKNENIKNNMEKYKNMASNDIRHEYGYKDVLKMFDTSVKRGRSQNEEEVNVFTDPKIKPVVTKIYNFDSSNYGWVVSEAVREISGKEEFEKYSGIPFTMFSTLLHHYNWSDKDLAKYIDDVHKNNLREMGYTNGVAENKIFDKMANSKFIKAVFSLVDFGVVIGDIRTLGHWGITVNNRIVLLDYGFTENNVDLYV